jgi:uncharacterized surface protein with fasciclin (FAS1) repeats
MSDTGSPGSPGSTSIQEVQGKGRWRIWMVAALVVVALVLVGLALWAADRQTAGDEEGTQEVATTEPASTTGVVTTEAATTLPATTEAPTTVPPTSAPPTTGASTTEAGEPTTSSPSTTAAEEFQGVLADLAERPEFSTLTALLAAAGIYELDEPVTIFAPTNDAFAALPEANAAYLTDPANVDVLREVLANHVVAGALFASDLPTGTSVTTLAGVDLEVTTEGGRLLIGGVPVVEADIEGGDGSVIHGIDGVLVPPDVELPA